jgi:ATP-dependent DNA ligase
MWNPMWMNPRSSAREDLGAKPTWLKPELVCEVNIAEITSDGKVRQASFKGHAQRQEPEGRYTGSACGYSHNGYCRSG